MSSPSVLVVDDHRDIREPLCRYLQKNGLKVVEADSAESARTLLRTSRPELVILDIMMPGEDGLSLCRYINSELCLPVILLTARDDDLDRVLGFELGADDYLVKPFNPRELLARIIAVHRRTYALPPSMATPSQGYAFGNWLYDQCRQECRMDSEVVRLSTGEAQLLEVFLQRPQQLLTRDRLLELCYTELSENFDRAIDNQVSRLRKKLEQDPKKPHLITTVWGRGYLFAATVKNLSVNEFT